MWQWARPSRPQVIAALLGVGACLIVWILLGAKGDETGATDSGIRAPRNGPGLGPPSHLTGGGQAEERPRAEAEETPPEVLPEAWSCRISALVLSGEDARPRSLADSRVIVTIRSSRATYEFPVAADGRATGALPLPADTARIACVARAGGGFASQLVDRSVVDGQTVGLVFYLLPGGSIRVRVVDPSGAPAPGAAIRVLERPRQPDRERKIKISAMALMTPSLYVWHADADGLADLSVRPGRVEMCALAPDGVRGVMAQVDIEAGELIDAGDLPMPTASVMVRGRVLDRSTGLPVEDAWVFLDGEITRLERSGEPKTSVRSDAEGRFELPVAREALPPRAAVGSRTHHMADVSFEARELEPVIELEPRPILLLRLVGEDGAAPSHLEDLAEIADWRLSSRGSFRHVSVGAGPAAKMLQVYENVSTLPERGAGAGAVVMRPPLAGSYDIRLSVPGGTHVHERVTIERGEHKTVDLPVPRLIPTRLRLEPDPRGFRSSAETKFKVLWSQAGEEPDTWAGRVQCHAERGHEEVIFWRPPDAVGVRVQPTRELSPYQTVALEVIEDGVTEVPIPVKTGLVPVDFQLTYDADPVPLGDALIWCVPMGPSQGPGARGILARTDALGRGRLLLIPGPYRAVSKTRFGVEARWAEFDVLGEGGDVVEVPTR